MTTTPCSRNATASAWQVRVGTSTWAEGGVVHAVERVVAWPGFTLDTYQRDVALVFLKTAIAFDERAQPVRLPARGAGGQATPGAYVTVTGWGQLGVGRASTGDQSSAAR